MSGVGNVWIFVRVSICPERQSVVVNRQHHHLRLLQVDARSVSCKYGDNPRTDAETSVDYRQNAESTKPCSKGPIRLNSSSRRVESDRAL